MVQVVGHRSTGAYHPRFPAYVRGELSPARWVCVFLQKMLGHSTLDMTRRYANLNTQDLQDVHERVSLLSLTR